MNTPRFVRATLCAALLAAAPAWAQTDLAAWSGSRANADALMSGLTRGASITLVTSGRGGSTSIAGFTPAAPMSAEEAKAALAAAQQSLARLGISHPSAEQIQAALIGGDVVLPNGGSRQLAGTTGVRAGGPLAAR